MRELLEQIGLPFAYSHFNKPQDPPYIVYIGNGQETFGSDNTWYYKENKYQIEYYYKLKNEANEEAIESVLLANGYNYEKSEDVFIDNEGVFVIYYQI